jgi:hypothetical protein
MKPHSFVQVVGRWSDVRTDPIHVCFENLEGLNHGNVPSGRGSRVCELANGLRLGTTVPSQDLSGTWVTIHG